MEDKKFFNIDLDSILSDKSGYRPVRFEGAQTEYKLYFPIDELNMFDELCVYRYPNGSTMLDFISDKDAPSNELMDYIAFCVNRWGNDSKGRGAVSENDVKEVKAGTFSRIWEFVQIKQCNYPAKPNRVFLLRLQIMSSSMSEFLKNIQEKKKSENTGAQNVVLKSENPDKNERKEIDKRINVRYKNPHLSVEVLILAAFCCFVFPYVGPVVVFILGLSRYQRKTAVELWDEYEHIHTPDRRYKTGSRYVGKVTVTKKRLIKAEQNDIKKYKLQGGLMMIFAVCGLAFDIIISVMDK